MVWPFAFDSESIKIAVKTIPNVSNRFIGNPFLDTFMIWYIF